MNSAGVTPASLVQKWQFEVQIAGFTAAKFYKTNLPSIELGEVTHAPAGSMFDQKAAGRVKFDDITLEGCVPQDNPELDIMAWVRQVITFNATGGVGSIGGVPIPSTQEGGYLRDVDIVQYDRQGNKLKTWTLYGAWPKKFEPGDHEGASEDNVVESITLAFQYFDVVTHK
jgi:phage tail-like protein